MTPETATASASRKEGRRKSRATGAGKPSLYDEVTGRIIAELEQEALDMLKAWNTGHPGGITTLHANSAHAGLYRLEQLIQEAVVTVPRRLIAEAIDIVVFLKGRGSGRRVETVAALDGLTSDGDYRLTPLTPVHLVPTA